MRNLHVALSSFCQFLEPGVTRGASSLVGRDGDAYRLRFPEGSSLDLLAFEEALQTAGRAQRARLVEEAATALALSLDIYRGDLLPEEGPAEWVVAERERYRSAAAGRHRRLLRPVASSLTRR
jgi:DNA-binding SARP family transcriptional activator